MRARFQQVVSQLVGDSEEHILLLGDIGVYGFRNLMESHPTKAINMGILEQAMTSFAAGLAMEGHIPILHSITPFLIERPLEQIKLDFGYQGLPGKFVSVGASYDYSALGATHHSPADVSLILGIEGFEVFLPGNSDELESQLLQNLSKSSLCYFRLSEDEFTHPTVSPTEHGPQLIRQGKNACIVALGSALTSSVMAAELNDTSLIYMNSITDSSIEKLEALLARSHADLVIVQPFHTGTFLPLLDLQSSPRRILDIGVPRKFIHTYGSREETTVALGLDDRSVNDRVAKFIQRGL